ncbi:transcriptional regulator, GntR family [Sphaerochaeta associata]|uniref:GntR family transcriptional regulator n=1 Tax=Sphaerochaeta associata TaxID=1129264 RepID=A0ABY4DCX1_9SPIR|nr:GntR family transcriptional regulator [Sphaerochaeta associata]UOM51825.1 GntR family transcriptional regulator [Sphaerochaeta associata]SMP60887.1 transcriptional regulator, GntR family [Sphaerochaeta associata]
MLYPNSHKPLYEQFKEIIVMRIANGEYRSNDLLSSEREFAEQFNISRVTVRQAISDLVKDGVLVRKHGKGTFVASGSKGIIENALGKLVGVVEELAYRNVKISVCLIEKSYETVSEDVAKKLKTNLEYRIFKVVRVVTDDVGPIAIDYSYVLENIGHLLDKSDLTKDIVYAILENYGYKISTADQNISAGSPSAYEANLLEIDGLAPVLVSERITFVEGRIPIMFNRSIYRADRYKYSLALKRYPLGIKSIQENVRH